jgi:hypothetical protein
MPFKIKNEAGEEVEILTAAEQSDMVTGAVKSHLDKTTKKLTADLTATLSEAMGKTLTEYETKREAAAVEAEEARKAAAGGNADDGKNKGNSAADIESSPAFRSMQKKLDAALKAQADSAALAKAEAAKTKDTQLRQRLSEELDKNGFDPKARHLALSHLVDGAKVARWADDGESIVFRDTDGSDVDLPTGLKSFAQTDDGKRFMPASGASGTGDRSRFTPPAQSKTGKVEAGTLGRLIMQAVDGAPQNPAV